jgi:hypothetical protein
MRLSLSIFFAIAASMLGMLLYPGNALLFVFFSAVYFAVLYSGFFCSFQYAHWFFALTWFIGIWLKPMVHFAFAHFGFDDAAQYLEATGSFDGSAAAWDQVLLIAAVGGLGYLTGRLILMPLVRRNASSTALLQPPPVYRRFRNAAWLCLAAGLIAVVVVNAQTAIILRGFVPRIELPWPLGGLFAWVTDIGFALAIAIFAAWDRAIGLGIVRGFVALCVEGAILSISTNSRGIYLFHTLPPLVSDGRALLFPQGHARRATVLFATWLFAAVAVPPLATGIRGMLAIEEYASEAAAKQADPKTPSGPVQSSRNALAGASRILTEPDTLGRFTAYAFQGTGRLLIDRWPGLEGIMSAVSFPERSFDLFTEAALQRRTYGMVDVYTGKISQTRFTEEQAKMFHSASIAGPVALFYFSNSLIIVFGGMVLLAALISLIEMLWTALIRDPLVVALSGFYLALVILQLSTGVTQAITGPFAVTFLFVATWCLGRFAASPPRGQAAQKPAGGA